LDKATQEARAAIARTDSRELAQLCVDICEVHKAAEVKLYDVTESSLLADYYMICTATSDPHLRALGGHIQKGLAEHGVRPLHVEGVPASHWMILDYGTVLVHIFDPKTRQYYLLEELWSEGKVVYEMAEEA